MPRVALGKDSRLAVLLPRGRDGYWGVIRAVGRDGAIFTPRGISRVMDTMRFWAGCCSASKSEIDSIRGFISSLQKGGFLARIGKGYSLVNDPGLVAPSLRRDGLLSKEGKRRDNLWRTMKMLVEFSARELAIQASIDGYLVQEATAKDYVKRLYKAGYLVCIKQSSNAGVLAQYRLRHSHNTGPLSPAVMKDKRVYDRNLRQVMGSA